MKVISVSNLSKTYSYYKKEQGIKSTIRSMFKRELLQRKALDSLELIINKGEFIGLIGPNGAGKTTLMKILAGIMYPDRDSCVNCLGYIPWELKHDYKKRFAIVMGQKSQLWWDLPAIDSFNLYRVIYEVPEKQYKSTLYELSDILDVSEFINVPVRKLSLGQRMKMEIILSLIHQPELILMDEPTIGLDGISRRRIKEFLSYINKEKNVTIILTSHYLEDVKELCGRLVIIDNGSIVYDGSTRDLITRNTESVIFHVSFTDPCIWSNWDNKSFPFTMEEDTAVFHASGKNIRVLGARLFTLSGIEDIGMERTPIDEIIEKIYGEGRDAFCRNI